MNVFTFSLLLILNVCIHCTSTYPLTRQETANITTTQTVVTTETTTVREIGATPGPSTSSWSRDRDLIFALCVVPGLWLLIFGGLICGAWYHMSYRKALRDWTKNDGADDPRIIDPKCRTGPDGRANWDNLYGIYSVQEAMDMINTFTLYHHRKHDRYIGNRMLPLYSIKGRELATIEHGFIDLHIEKRPQFTFERIDNEISDRNHEKWLRMKAKREKQKAKQGEKEAKRAEKKERRKADMADSESTDRDSETPGSVKSDSSGCEIIPVQRIDADTELAEEIQTEEENKSDVSAAEIPKSPKSRGDVASEVEPPTVTPTGKGELPTPDDRLSAGEAPLPGAVTIVPPSGNDQELRAPEEVV